MSEDETPEVDPAIAALISETVKHAVAAAVQELSDNPPVPREYFNDKRGVAYLDLRSDRALEVMRRDGKGPKFRRVNGRWPFSTKEQLDEYALSFPEIDPAEPE